MSKQKKRDDYWHFVWPRAFELEVFTVITYMKITVPFLLEY